jgi:hypothetical protein
MDSIESLQLIDARLAQLTEGVGEDLNGTSISSEEVMELVTAGLGSLSMLMDQYAYPAAMETDGYDVSNETYAVATFMTEKLIGVGKLAAAAQETDSPGGELSTDNFAMSFAKRSFGKVSGPEAPPFEVKLAQTPHRSLESDSVPAVRARITAPASQIAAIDPSLDVDAVLVVSNGLDFSGAGSKRGQKISGAQVSFTLSQKGKTLSIQGLEDPLQLTVPLDDAADVLTKCTGQPDERSQLKGMFNSEPACRESIECRFWDNDQLQWSTRGCRTVLYNSTESVRMGAFTGCECSHLSEYVSVTVPTDAFGTVEFGSLDVADGNITHVSGQRGGTWLSVQKGANSTPPTSFSVYLAYADISAAPDEWEITDLACEQGPAFPLGAFGISAQGPSGSVSSCHWIREVSSTGNLTDEMVLNLSGSGLAEDRGAEAYVAYITYVLVHKRGTAAEQRREFTAPIFASVLAAPVAARSVRGLVPPGGRCEQTPSPGDTRAIAVELGQTSIVPFSLCDLEGFPTNQPELASPSWGLTSTLHRPSSPSRSLRFAEPPNISFSGGSRYDVGVSPPALGRWVLFVFLGGEQIHVGVTINTFCPIGQVPLPGGENCGCSAGTILKPGRVWPLRDGQWASGDGQWASGDEMCTRCERYGTWSIPGDADCDYCAEGFYKRKAQSIGHSDECTPCPSFAVCAAYTDLETLHLRRNFWRLSNRTLDARTCVTSDDEEAQNRSPCLGGNASGDGGDGYCLSGHAGPLCRRCLQAGRFFDPHVTGCEPCSVGAWPLWAARLLEYVLPLAAVGLLALVASALLKSRAKVCARALLRIRRALLRLQRLLRSINLTTRLKLLVGFYQICGALEKAYGVELPPEYFRHLGWLTWLGDVTVDMIVPTGCVGTAYSRLLVTGVLPVLIAVLGAAGAVACGLLSSLKKLDNSDGHAKSQHWLRRMPSMQWHRKMQRRKEGTEAKTGREIAWTSLGAALPWLLPFSYLCSTSIATQAFSVFSCTSFETDAATGSTISFLTSDVSVRCELGDPEYAKLRRAAIVLIACVGSVPLLYLILLLKARHAIVTHAPTKLSVGCRFLWGDYKDAYWFSEPLQQLRKLILTGFVMMYPSSMPNARILTAMVVILTFLVLQIYSDPFRSETDSRLFSLQQVLLFILFEAAMLMRLCEDQPLCRSFGFEGPFTISMACIGWNLTLLVVILTMIVHQAYHQGKAHTLRMKGGKEPVLTLEQHHHYHVFLSHIWSTGQDQVAVVKRQLQLLLPSVRAFLDIDDLVEIGELEQYIRDSACILIFLSKGYFCSRNCLREVRATSEQQKPISLVHEADPAKGGLPLDKSKLECPAELRSIFLADAAGQQGQAAPDREVITWLRVKDFQMLSLRLICSSILHASPYYQDEAHHRGELVGLYVPGDILSQRLTCDFRAESTVLIHCKENSGAYAFGKEVVRAVPGVVLLPEQSSDLRIEEHDQLKVGDRVLHAKHGLGVVCGYSHRGCLITFDSGESHTYRQSSVRAKITKAPKDAPIPPNAPLSEQDSMPSPSQVASMPSFSHLPARRLLNEGGEASKNIDSKLTDRSHAGSGGEVKPKLIVYLNERTWEGSDGQQLADIVRVAMQKSFSILMVHETDEQLGGIEFSHFFQCTPSDLVDNGLYATIAIALHRAPHREVSLALVARACDALPSNLRHLSKAQKQLYKSSHHAHMAAYRAKHLQRHREDLERFDQEETLHRHSSHAHPPSPSAAPSSTTRAAMSRIDHETRSVSSSNHPISHFGTAQFAGEASPSAPLKGSMRRRSRATTTPNSQKKGAPAPAPPSAPGSPRLDRTLVGNEELASNAKLARWRTRGLQEELSALDTLLTPSRASVVAGPSLALQMQSMDGVGRAVEETVERAFDDIEGALAISARIGTSGPVLPVPADGSPSSSLRPPLRPSVLSGQTSVRPSVRSPVE